MTRAGLCGINDPARDWFSTVYGVSRSGVQDEAMDTNMATVLLLEDEPLIAMDLEYGLREVGFDVAIVATCSEAIDWLEVCRPDVVIVDIL